MNPSGGADVFTDLPNMSHLALELLEAGVSIMFESMEFVISSSRSCISLYWLEWLESVTGLPFACASC